jgi:excinuclease UvrABC nuclease subunit
MKRYNKLLAVASMSVFELAARYRDEIKGLREWLEEQGI